MGIAAAVEVAAVAVTSVAGWVETQPASPSATAAGAKTRGAVSSLMVLRSAWPSLGFSQTRLNWTRTRRVAADEEARLGGGHEVST